MASKSSVSQHIEGVTVSSEEPKQSDVESGSKEESNSGARRGWSDRLGMGCSIEVNGITPTTIEERKDPRTYQLFTVWLSAVLNFTSVAVGALGPQLFGLDFKTCAFILVVADVIGCLVPGCIAVFGPKLGTRTMVQSRFSFGYYGSILPSVFNVFSEIGYLILASITGGQLLTAVSPHLSNTLGIVIISLVSFVISFCGYRVLHWFDTYAWIPNAILFITLLAVGGNKLNLRPEVATPTVAAIISFGTSAGASCVSWGPMTADYGIYHRSNVSGSKLFLYSYLGLLLSTFPGHIIGAALVAAAPAVPAWNDALREGTNFGNFIVVVLLPLGGFGKFLIVLATLMLPAQNSISMYSFGVSLMNVSWIFAKVPRYVYSIVATAIVIPVSIVGATTFFQTFQSILNIAGYWTASYAAVVLAEHFIFRRSHFSTYKVEFWNDASRLPLGFAAVVAFGLSFGLIVPSMLQAWYTGEFARRGTGDIGLITGFFSAGVFYVALRVVEKRMMPVHDA